MFRYGIGVYLDMRVFFFVALKVDFEVFFSGEFVFIDVVFERFFFGVGT